jgi:hypothetical protein
MLQLSDVQVFNLALLKLGETAYPVTAVDGSDTSRYGRIAWPLYYMTRAEELRSYNWIGIKKRANLVQAQVTASSTWTSGSATIAVATAGIQPGWLVSNAIMQGGGAVSVPAGIPAGATVLSITDSGHLVMSANATANGSGPIVYQVNNLTGYWYVYIAPSDCLRAQSIYSVFADYTYIWPYKIQNIQNFSYIYEAGYIYTNMDPANANPTIEYVADISTGQQYATGTTAGTTALTAISGVTMTPAMVGWYVIGTGIPIGTTIAAWVSSSAVTLSQAATASASGVSLAFAPPMVLPMDFCEALATRLAIKLCETVKHDQNKEKLLTVEYGMVIDRARGNNQIEAKNDALGELWWTDRGR